MILSLVNADDCCCAVNEVAAGAEQAPANGAVPWFAVDVDDDEAGATAAVV